MIMIFCFFTNLCTNQKGIHPTKTKVKKSYPSMRCLFLSLSNLAIILIISFHEKYSSTYTLPRDKMIFYPTYEEARKQITQPTSLLYQPAAKKWTVLRGVSKKNPCLFKNNEKDGQSRILKLK